MVTTHLSSWSQVAPRSYVRFVLCFPLATEDQARCAAHLRASLARLSRDNRDYAGRLFVPGPDNGAVWLQDGLPDEPIDLVAHDISAAPALAGAATFDQLEREGFAPARFVGPAMRIPACEAVSETPIPGVLVRALFVPGGLMLAVYLHHSLGDGMAMDTFLHCFAQSTMGAWSDLPPDHRPDRLSEAMTTMPPPSLPPLLPPPAAPGISSTPRLGRHAPTMATTTTTQPLPPPLWETRLRALPEYTILRDRSGPSNPIQFPGGTPLSRIRCAGKIFVISTQTMARLKRMVVAVTPARFDSSGQQLPARPAPSSYVVLAALVWAHVTEARITTERHAPPPATSTSTTTITTTTTTTTKGAAAGLAEPIGGGAARLFTPVNWRTRTCAYRSAPCFGNAVAQGVTIACTDDVRIARVKDLGLARLVAAIEEALGQIDEQWVSDRTEVLDSVADPRAVGLAFDSRAPQNLHFNTWRRLGAETRWKLLPGRRAPRVMPSAIRRAQTGWNLGGALVMPAADDDAPYEICITLAKESMAALCADRRWMRWVSRVVG